MALQEINDSNFDQVIQNGLVIVDFWAPWCAPCRMVAPVLEEISKEYEGKVTVTKLNVDENNQSAAKFSVTSIPTLILFKDGEVVDRTVGAGPKQTYISMISKFL